MNRPLAEKHRPQTLDDVVGQSHLIGANGIISEMIEQERATSILLYGPPGCGKTTIARLYAKSCDPSYISFSATTNRLSELKKMLEISNQQPLFKKKNVVFVDEIHRFNKAQQDAFLPLIEQGELILIGATTENPSFAINSALLSRLKTFTLNHLNDDSLRSLLERFLQASPLKLQDDVKETIIGACAGDGRYLFSLLEMIEMRAAKTNTLDLSTLKELIQQRPSHYDKGAEQHYNLISALHKAIRGSDPNGALYWFSRMVQGGEDLMFIARRLVRAASEDIGLADPTALRVALDATAAYQMLGSPEGELALSNCVIYLSLAPKSNAGYLAHKAALSSAEKTSALPPPMHILNAPTKWMKDEGYGKGYQYDHDAPGGCSGQQFLPDGLEGEAYYQPIDRGFEREMSKRLSYFQKFRS